MILCIPGGMWAALPLSRLLRTDLAGGAATHDGTMTMTISQQISDFTSALEATRAKLNEVCNAISVLEQERSTVELKPPHTDDIVAFLRRSIEDGAKDFETQFAAYLQSRYVKADGAAKAISGLSVNLLKFEAEQPSIQTIMDRRNRNETPPLNLSILAYFLSENMLAKLPELVERLCPAAANGIRKAERREKLDEIDARLSALRAEQSALQADIAAARRAAR
jgi:hypothetical protein